MWKGLVTYVAVFLLREGYSFSSRGMLQCHSRVHNSSSRGSCADLPQYMVSDESPCINGTDRRPRRRCVDFPSFAYDDPSSTPAKKLVIFSEPTDAISASATKTRLLKGRSYARPEPFAAANLNVPPTLRDIATTKSSLLDRFFVSTPANVFSFTVAYFGFPFLIELLHEVITTSKPLLDEMLTTFTPGISILYGTFTSLTLSILYNRQRMIQDHVAVECSLLTILLRSVLSLFRDDRCKSVEAGQCVADQVRTLVRSSRGEELMLLVYSDPYARILELVDLYEYETIRSPNVAVQSSATLVSFCRDTIRQLAEYRSKRLSDETPALPPTHFLILNILTALILMCYSISVVPTIDVVSGRPPHESSLLFGTLATVYILFYNFANDLNNPFEGLYQIRRSCAASHLLEIKWLIAQHPALKGNVDFEEVAQDTDGSISIRSPGIGDFSFERDDIYIPIEDRADTRLTNENLTLPKL